MLLLETPELSGIKGSSLSLIGLEVEEVRVQYAVSRLLSMGPELERESQQEPSSPPQLLPGNHPGCLLCAFRVELSTELGDLVHFFPPISIAGLLKLKTKSNSLTAVSVAQREGPGHT